MAVGTLTVADRIGHDGLPLFVDVISFAGDAAYPTGGTAGFEATVQAAVDRGSLDVIAVMDVGGNGYVPVYDRANNKLKVFYSNSDAADGPLIEVPNTTDLSGQTFKLAVLSC